MSTDGRRLTPLKYSTKVYSGGKVRNGYTSDRNGRNGYTSISLRQVKLTSPGVRGGGVLIPVRRVAARGYPQNPPELTPAEVNFTWRTKGGSEALVAYQGGVRSQECGPPLGTPGEVNFSRRKLRGVLGVASRRDAANWNQNPPPPLTPGEVNFTWRKGIDV